MLSLHIAGALERCPTLPSTVDIELLRHFPYLDFYDEFYFFPEILDVLERSDADIDVVMRAALLEGIAASREYFDRLKKARKIIDKLISPRHKFILVDQDKNRSKLGDGRDICPFLERNGELFGAPDNGDTAVRELERLRRAEARFIVLWYTEFWWLEHYKEFEQHLQSNYRSLLEDEDLIILEL